MKQKINWDKYFKRNSPKTSPLDLGQLFPDYFNKWVFRGFVAFMVLLFIFTIQTNDWRLKYNYAVCPETQYLDCVWDVKGEELILSPGEIYGMPPNEHAQKFNGRVTWLTVLSFITNHLFYWARTKNFKIPINKKRMAKLKEALQIEN